MTRGRRREALKRRMRFLAGRLSTTERHQASAYDGAELSALEWVLGRETRLDWLERLAANQEVAMDLWWTTTGDDQPVPEHLPAAYLQAALRWADGRA